MLHLEGHRGAVHHVRVQRVEDLVVLAVQRLTTAAARHMKVCPPRFSGHLGYVERCTRPVNGLGRFVDTKVKQMLRSSRY